MPRGLYEMRKFWETQFSNFLVGIPENKRMFNHQFKLSVKKTNGKLQPLDKWSLNKIKELVSAEWVEEHVIPDLLEEEEVYY